MSDYENRIIRKRIYVYGSVQGVGFRYRTEHAANAVGATGWVHNESDGSVLLEIQGTEEQIDECRRYSVEDIFCCCYAPYFWQAIQIRYPEYATYNKNLYAMFGGND